MLRSRSIPCTSPKTWTRPSVTSCVCSSRGRLFAFYAAYSKVPAGPADFEPSGTKFGLALSRQGLRFETVDFTSNDHSVWRRLLHCAQDMEDEFRAEGNLDLCSAYIDEAEEVLQCIDKGMACRYLYMVATLPRSCRPE